MPAGQGESLVTTLFADIHYYFNDPSSKPQHHRFDRGSYLYLFHHAAENGAKLEIANHAGTPDQDAFSGNLNVANIRYSYNQPNLFTIVIDGGAIQGHDQWHLPNFDEKNTQKYLYKINTLDIYLWTEKDAATFLASLKSVLPSNQLDIKDTPSNVQETVEHEDSMSPVVQQLERTAVSPDFTPERQESVASLHSLPGSPPAASPQPVAAPMAYNPAAPAAPEPIAHREKTPPPVDTESGTRLGNAAKYDSIPQSQYTNVPNTFSSSNQYNSQQSYFPGPPQQYTPGTNFPGPPQSTPPSSDQRPQSGSFPPPPPQPGSNSSGQQYTPSFGPPPAQQQSLGTYASSPPPNQQNVGRQGSFGPPGQQYSNQPQQRTPSFGPTAASSPGMPGTQPAPPAPPSSSNQQQTFGYSNYNYTTGQQTSSYGQPGAYGSDVHNQAYRPTAEEAGAHGRPVSSGRKNSEQRQRLEDKVGRVEAGVGKYLKRLDKLW